MEALRTYLKAAKLTQTQFAERVGVKQGSISDLLRHRASPSLKLLKRIAQVTGISIDVLASDAGHDARQHKGPSPDPVRAAVADISGVTET